MHLYNLQCYSDFLKGHNDQTVVFDIRENNDRLFKNDIKDLTEEPQSEINKDDIEVSNINNYKINVDPKNYYSKRIMRGEYLSNDYGKVGGIK